MLLAEISHAKDELLTPDDLEKDAEGFIRKRIAEVYREYQLIAQEEQRAGF